jgi:hypothetical protein
MSDKPANYNSANVAHTKNRKRAEDRAKERDAEARSWVMGDPRGRHFFWMIIEEAGIFKNPFTGNSVTDFNCGRGDVGRKLLKLMETDFPDEIVVMWGEHLKIEQAERKLDEAARTVQGNGAEQDNAGA